MKLKYDPKQLILARLLFDHAAEHRSHKTALGYVQAVAGYANAVELVLKAIADNKNVSPLRKYFNIHDLLESLENKLPNSQRLPRKQDIYELAEVRNLAMHHGTIPSETAVEKCHVFTLDFLRESLTRFFHKSFDDLDMIDYVRSEKVKELLKLSKTNLSSDDVFDSRIPAKLAFVIYSENLYKLFPANPGFQHFRADSKLFGFRAQQELTTVDEAMIENIQDLHRYVSIEIEEVKAYLAL